MRIRDLRTERTGGLATAAARFEWEDSDRPRLDVYFRVNDSLGAHLRASVEGFLIAGFFPGARHSERRIAVDGPVCPRVRDGLQGAGRLFRLWYGREAPRIESRHGWRAASAAPSDSTASFLTGGVDSLHALWKNHRLYPSDHAGRVGECLFVFGVEMPGLEDTPAAALRLETVRPLVDRVTRDAGVGLRRVDTNVRRLEPDSSFWGWEYVAPPLIAAAHQLADRFSKVILGSSYDFRNLVPWGTHPLLDPLLGSTALSIEHVEAATPRLEKLRELLAWPLALRGLLVCGNSPAQAANCGKCAKCLRAMAELIAVGAPQPETLPLLSSLRPAQIDALEAGSIDVENFWAATVSGLEQHGRRDLARVVSRYARRLRAVRHPTGFRSLKGRISKLDERRLGGRLHRVADFVRSGRRPG